MYKKSKEIIIRSSAVGQVSSHSLEYYATTTSR